MAEATAESDRKFSEVPKAERRLLSWINIIYAVMFIAVGLPIWWKTTTVYRAWLPHSEIDTLYARRVVITQHVELISCDPWTSSMVLRTLEAHLWPALRKEVTGSKFVDVRYEGSARECSAQEVEIFRTSASLDELEQGLEPVRSFAFAERSLIFFIVPHTTSLLPKNSPGLLKRSGIVYLRANEDVTQMTALIQSLIRKVLVGVEDLAAGYEDLRNPQASPRPDRLRQFRSAAAYDVVFTLINCRPQSAAVSWDMTQALRFFVDPLASKIGRYISLSFKSQFLYYVDIPIRPRTISGQPGSYFAVDDLPHLINAFEHYLSDGASVNPTIHLIAYIPPEDQHPLRMRREKNSNLPDAFLSPRWGGVMAYNIEPSKNQSQGPVKHEMDMRKVMSIFVGQLRALLGISRSLPVLITTEGTDDSKIAAWELQAWLRRRAVEQIALATMTLSSLSDLLGKVNNMVIQDYIADEVLRSVEALKVAMDRLEKGFVNEAFAASKQALVAAERAFFDPSLLELLYFSDDQKYAIYVPLFLPLGIPLLLGLVKGVRFLWGREVKPKTE